MSGLEPAVLAAIIGSAGAVGSSIIGSGGGGQGGSFFQGAQMQPQALVPPGFEDAYKMAGQLAMQRMQEPQYVAPMNPMSLGGANIASQFYMGQPYQQPGLMQYRPGQGGLGMGGGMPGQGMPGGQMPGMGGGMPRQPMMPRPGGIPMPGMPSPIGGAPWMQGGGRQPLPR